MHMRDRHRNLLAEHLFFGLKSPSLTEHAALILLCSTAVTSKPPFLSHASATAWRNAKGEVIGGAA